MSTSRPPVLCDTGGDLLDRLGVEGSMRTSRTIEILSCSAVARELIPRKQSKPLTLAYGYRVIATLVQATGVERRPPCDRCARANGPWKQCVVLQSPEGIRTTKGRLC
ncbi:hypothetical protein BDP55DRAFT_422495 [Colletotrichum godetiae]|uniref:Uncharacterized protein n=1 Tax=Colletotrichum godetiae TaxID=1209918 RepID=A0AAJ0A6Z9_9PEZI|nr:uncharacterized protein BDP55DRAFT_422495 [Colletotrichum godetiae]KAK1657657.1 hypothetical protein BDP55DRAFT_422495 [Colletotrichum godetiae]